MEEMLNNKKMFWAILLLPICVTVCLAWFFFIPLPIFDYWDVLHSGLTLADTSLWGQLRYAWEPFVDQKMVFPKSLIRYLAVATGNNHYGLEIVFGIIGQLVVLFIVASLITRTPSLTSKNKSILILISSWLLFWPNILIRFQHHWYSTQYTFVLVFTMLSIFTCLYCRNKWASVLLSLVFASTSALSHGTGFIYLLCFLCVVFFIPGWSKLQKFVSLSGALTVVLVIVSQMPKRGDLLLPPLNWFTDRPVDELVFIFRCFGPDGVLRPITGFLILGIGLCSCGALFIKKEIFSGKYFAWVLMFFWGGSVAFLSGVARSSVSSSPMRVYFYFFVLILISVIVLAVISYPKTSLSKRKAPWNFLSTVAVILYIVGCADGIHDAAKSQKRILSCQEHLEFFPVLVENDFHYLFPHKRIKNILESLHAIGVIDEIDTRPFVQKTDVHFSKMIRDGELYFVPDRELISGELAALPVESYADLTGVCYWDSGDGWKDEQSQHLRQRAIDGNFWVIFLNKEVLGFDKPVKMMKIKFQQEMGRTQIQGLAEPTVWARTGNE